MMEGIGIRRKFRTMQMDAAAASFLVYYLLVAALGSLNIFTAEAQQVTKPLECEIDPSLPARSCSAYLYVEADQTVEHTTALYNYRKVYDPPWTTAAEFYLVQADCFCSNYNGSLTAYFASTTYTVNASDTSLADISDRLFNNMAFVPQPQPTLSPGLLIEIDLLCGCPDASSQSDPLQQAMVTYVVRNRDTLLGIENTLHSDTALTLRINEIANKDLIVTGQSLFVPISSIPTRLAGTPANEPGNGTKRARGSSNKAGMVAGGVVAVVVLLLLLLLMGVLLHRRRQQRRDCPERAAYNVFGSVSSRSSEIAKSKSTSTSTSVSRRFSRLSSVFSRCAVMGGQRGCRVNDNVKRNIPIPREAMSVFDQEKPVVFQYNEILVATQNFDQAKKLGQGAFGTVFRGNLRHQDVAIKQMKATKTKEFLAELKVLCKVHHTNLIELLGYSAGEEDLFLVYEFAEKGSLSDHLHDPVSKGHVPLTWTARVQIAIDAARGLEYIHEHTKTQYVHRDVKTRNILLDNFYRAKLADFGLAKLVEQKDGAPDVIKTATLSGTFGYLAPEYVRDGLATSKSDVYAFGVVIFELITGREALAAVKPDPTSDSNKSTQSRQSLISSMLRILDPENDDVTKSKKFRSCVDPNLDGNYPFDAAYKMAQLGRACIDEDPGNRPDMKQVVFAISQNLLTSIEWEAALAGSSQIFSGLVQGR